MVAACGSSSSEQVSVSRDEPAIEVAPIASPLEARLGFASEPGRRQAQLIELQRQADQTVVQCMQDAGFSYVAGRAEESLRTGGLLPDGTRAWVEENGLGVTKILIDAVEAAAVPSRADADAANQTYVASLTALEAVAYDRALIGSSGSEPADEAYVPAGCWGTAYGDMLTKLSFIEEFRTELDTLNSRLASDPRVQAFGQSWSACMAAAGHRYESETELSNDLYARLLDVELIETDAGTTFADRALVDELSSFEQRVGLASFDCRLEYIEELEQLRFDYEQEFLDDNRFRIADLLPPP